MADFCGTDSRLMGVGIVPLDDPSRAMAELEFALELGLEAIWVPHRAPIDRSPGHVDLEPFWALLGRVRHTICVTCRRLATASVEGLEQ